MRSAADFERDINMGIFSLDMHEFATLDGTLTRLVTEIRPAVAVLLNEMGFQWRGHVVDFLRQGMIVRSPGFLRSRMYVEKTKVGPVESMSTRVGSLFARAGTSVGVAPGLSIISGITFLAIGVLPLSSYAKPRLVSAAARSPPWVKLLNAASKSPVAA